MAATARTPVVLYRQAAAWASRRAGPDREPGRGHDHEVRLASRAAARAPVLPAAARSALLVSAAPGFTSPSDALGLADRPRDAAAAHRRQRRGHLRHRRLS